MIRNYRLVAVVIFSLGVAVALIPQARVVGADAKAPPEPCAGRYHFFKSPKLNEINEECLLDTGTGKVWRLESDNQRRLHWVLAVDAPK